MRLADERLDHFAKRNNHYSLINFQVSSETLCTVLTGRIVSNYAVQDAR
jgi:hypothetical protein